MREKGKKGQSVQGTLDRFLRWDGIFLFWFIWAKLFSFWYIWSPLPVDPDSVFDLVCRYVQSPISHGLICMNNIFDIQKTFFLSPEMYQSCSSIHNLPSPPPPSCIHKYSSAVWVPLEGSICIFFMFPNFSLNNSLNLILICHESWNHLYHYGQGDTILKLKF